MASCDGCTLEYWVDESVYNVSDEIRHEIVAILEPFRESIENQIDDYDEETQSWRDYRNAMWSTIPQEIHERIENVYEEHHGHTVDPVD